MKHLPAVIAAIMLAMLAACSHFAPDEADGSCSAFSTFGDRGWRYFDTLTLAADSTADSIRHGALILNLRHSTAYPWRNICSSSPTLTAPTAPPQWHATPST